MSIELTDGFQKTLRNALKKYPKSLKSIKEYIEKRMEQEVKQHDVTPYMGLSPPFEVRKVRYPLSEYNIGSSKGLRINYLFNQETNLLLPLFVYKKDDTPESKRLSATKACLQSVLKELSEKKS